jgi:hypothetical protein
MLKDNSNTSAQSTARLDDIVERFLSAYSLDALPSPISLMIEGYYEGKTDEIILDQVQPCPEWEGDWQFMFGSIPDYIVNYMHRAVGNQNEPLGQRDEVLEFLTDMADVWGYMDHVRICVCEIGWCEAELNGYETSKCLTATSADDVGQVMHSHGDERTTEDLELCATTEWPGLEPDDCLMGIALEQDVTFGKVFSEIGHHLANELEDHAERTLNAYTIGRMVDDDAVARDELALTQIHNASSEFASHLGLLLHASIDAIIDEGPADWFGVSHVRHAEETAHHR